MQQYTVIAVIRNDEVLMQYKLRGPFINVWNLPGGKVEPTETNIIESACRELKEETGIEIAPVNMTKLLTMTYFEECPAELHLMCCEVSTDRNFVQKEDEPLVWVKCDIVEGNKLPTAGHLNVPHFVRLTNVFLNPEDKCEDSGK